MSRSSPVSVATNKTWAAVTAGGGYLDYYYAAHTLALATDGTLWAWGANAQPANASVATVIAKAKRLSIDEFSCGGGKTAWEFTQREVPAA